MFRTAILSAVALTAPAAHAAGELYFGGGIDHTTVHNILSSPPCGNLCDSFHYDATSWQVIAGWRPLAAFAVEANYMDLGSGATHLSHGTAHFDADAVDLDAVGFVQLPIRQLEIYGKAGVAHWEVKGHSYTFSPFTSAVYGPTFGVGVQMHPAPPVGLRLEYDHFNVANSTGGNVLGMAVTFAFR